MARQVNRDGAVSALNRNDCAVVNVFRADVSNEICELTAVGSNENKMSDGGRGRALLGVFVLKSS